MAGQELTIQKQPNTSLKDNGPPSNSGGQTPQSNSNQKSPAGYVSECQFSTSCVYEDIRNNSLCDP